MSGWLVAFWVLLGLVVWVVWVWANARARSKLAAEQQRGSYQYTQPEPHVGHAAGPWYSSSHSEGYHRLDLDLADEVPATGHLENSYQPGLSGDDACSSDAATPAVLAQLGIQHRAGQFRCRGYSFATFAQAAEYARRSELTAPPRPAATYSENRDSLSAGANGRPRWVPAGETVVIAGVRIDGGMIYVGRRGAADTWRRENCLIDPTLPVSGADFDHRGETLGYWCAYGEIRPPARAAYLAWLAGGRERSDVGIGYVFLFFYGLERRLFIDLALDELEVIVAEVRRLLTIYGENYSLSGYAHRLLEAAELLTESEVRRPAITTDTRNGFEIPLAVRRYLGTRLAAKTPFDAEDALLWLVSLPDTYLRTPATRCLDELRELWRVRYDERYPSGISPRSPKRRIRGVYRAASSRFEVNISVGDLPDISAVQGPIAGLRDLLTSCTDELDAYSRLIGRKPEARGTLEAAVCLPSELAESRFAIGMQQVRRVVDELFGEERITAVDLRRLCEIVGIELLEPKVVAATHRHLGSILDRLDIAFEPDRRYGSGSLAIDGEAVIFRAEGGGAIDPDRPDYSAARTMVEIAALAATSDGVVAPAEFDSISKDLAAMDGLSAADRTRLLAHAFYLLRTPPKQQAALNRLSQLSLLERSRVVSSAVSAVLADGHVRPDEVRFLERLHKAVGLPKEDVYATLHRGSVVIDEPVIVATESWSRGAPIPSESMEAIAIDDSRLARIRSETAEVSKLLAGIFAEDDTTGAPPKQRGPSATVPTQFAGLDSAHANLLEKVLGAGSLDRSSFDQHARDLRLLPDGALETINEWAFEVFDEPILEGEEAVVAAEHLREQLGAGAQQ